MPFSDAVRMTALFPTAAEKFCEGKALPKRISVVPLGSRVHFSPLFVVDGAKPDYILKFSSEFRAEYNLSGFCNKNLMERPEHDWKIQEVAGNKYEGSFQKYCSIVCCHCNLSRIVEVEQILKEECIVNDEHYVELLLSKVGY